MEKTETLLQFPTIGRVVPEINDNNIREIFIHSYRVMYEIENDNIVIHAVMHGKRDFDKAFEYNEEDPHKQ